MTNKQRVRRIGKDALDQNSTFLSASLANGAVESVVMVDQGTDTNLMPPSVLEHVESAGAAFRVTQVYPPH